MTVSILLPLEAESGQTPLAKITVFMEELNRV